MKRYTFSFSNGGTFSIIADSIEQAESYLNNPLRLLSIDKIPHVKIKNIPTESEV